MRMNDTQTLPLTNSFKGSCYRHDFEAENGFNDLLHITALAGSWKSDLEGQPPVTWRYLQSSRFTVKFPFQPQMVKSRCKYHVCLSWPIAPGAWYFVMKVARNSQLRDTSW
jgi:hypothetical protein